MNKKMVHFVIPLVNVDDSVDGLELFQNFVIEKWPIDKLAGLIEKFPGHRDDIVADIEYTCCLNSGESYVCVVAGKVDNKVYWKKIPESASFEEKYSDRGLYLRKIEDKISLMRLYKEGQVQTNGKYIYDINKKEVEPIQNSDLEEPKGLEIPFSITKRGKEELNLFLKKYNTPLTPPFIQLAFENFTQSYSIEYIELAYLSLMMGVEVIFNDGHQELKYRVSRGMAVLLGSKYDSMDIYKSMRIYYDKRSKLIHTGKCDNLTVDDMGRLRFLLRESIKKLLELHITKESLMNKLTVSGFGDKITQ